MPNDTAGNGIHALMGHGQANCDPNVVSYTWAPRLASSALGTPFRHFPIQPRKALQCCLRGGAPDVAQEQTMLREGCSGELLGMVYG